ncbi:hypothetical protein O3P69_011301 [Scylla paramamosain]|uniref:Ig-like domain-containing protein n=1 Tax=Scylla paramamosain TaxID=85552 RepID=A0AAW0SHF8_SCYPA
MNLRPLSVRVEERADPLVAGQQYSFSCESQGSRPSATITWFEDGVEVDSLRTHTRSSPGEITIGTLTLVPTQGDHGSILKCQASNPLVPGSGITDTVELNVQYPPVVVLEMGRNLVPSAIKQGDDVYFECRVKANPPPYRVTWARGVSIYLFANEREPIRRYLATQSPEDG